MNPRPALKLAAVAAILMSNAGCFRLADDWVNLTPWQALDYVIDRPRVVAIQFDPPLLVHGVETRIEPLVLAPRGVSVQSARLDACGIDPDRRVYVSDVGCFSNPDLVSAVAGELPASWDPPALSDDLCADTGGPQPSGDTGWLVLNCSSNIGLLVTAELSDGTTGRAAVFPPLTPLSWDPSDPLPPTVKSRGSSLAAPAKARPGETVALTLLVGDTTVPEVRWYVDGGELRKTGRTSPQALVGESLQHDNLLVIPDDWSGPMRVVAVWRSGRYALSGDMAWVVHEIEVAP